MWYLLFPHTYITKNSHLFPEYQRYKKEGQALSLLPLCPSPTLMRRQRGSLLQRLTYPIVPERVVGVELATDAAPVQVLRRLVIVESDVPGYPISAVAESYGNKAKDYTNCHDLYQIPYPT